MAVTQNICKNFCVRSLKKYKFNIMEKISEKEFYEIQDLALVSQRTFTLGESKCSKTAKFYWGMQLSCWQSMDSVAVASAFSFKLIRDHNRQIGDVSIICYTANFQEQIL